MDIWRMIWYDIWTLHTISYIKGIQIIMYGCNWANYNDLSTTSPWMMVSKRNHPQMVLIQVSEI